MYSRRPRINPGGNADSFRGAKCFLSICLFYLQTFAEFLQLDVKSGSYRHVIFLYIKATQHHVSPTLLSEASFYIEFSRCIAKLLVTSYSETSEIGL